MGKGIRFGFRKVLFESCFSEIVFFQSGVSHLGASDLPVLVLVDGLAEVGSASQDKIVEYLVCISMGVLVRAMKEQTGVDYRKHKRNENQKGKEVFHHCMKLTVIGVAEETTCSIFDEHVTVLVEADEQPD